jgi:hypothetical protein
MPDDQVPPHLPSVRPTKPTWPALSQRLKALLANDADEAFQRITTDPAMLAECKANWSALTEAARAPAGEEGVMRVVVARFPVFPQPERSEGEWRVWWAAYTDALEDLPEEALEAGMREYLRQPDAEFMPKPGKLRELARQATTQTARAAGIAARCAAYTPPDLTRGHPPTEPPKLQRMPTAEERKREVVLAQDVCRQLSATAAKGEPPPRQWTVPPTDEHGVTQAMRDAMVRRQELDQ